MSKRPQRKATAPRRVASSPRARASSVRRPRAATRRPGIAEAQRSWILGLVALALAFLTALALVPRSDRSLFSGWQNLLSRAFGWGRYGVPVAMGAAGVWALTRPRSGPRPTPWARVAGSTTLAVALLALFHLFLPDPARALEEGHGGGIAGYWLSQGLESALGRGGAVVIILMLLGMGLILAFDLSLAKAIADSVDALRAAGRFWARLCHGLRRRFAVPPRQIQLWEEGNLPAPVETPRPPRWTSPPPDSTAVTAAMPAPQPVTRGAPGDALPIARVDGKPQRWVLPNPAEMLAETEETQMSLSDIREKAHLIEETLTSLGVPASVVEVNPGPVVTQFGLEPGYLERRDRQGRVKRVKIKVSNIAALANDLSLALAAAPIRIEAPVPGKGIVGVEVPNDESAIVGLRGVIESEQYRALGPAPLAIGFGRDVSGTPVVDDLAALPHLLIAGATGSGKSVCLNALIACLLCRNTPGDLRLLMVDPKRVELSGYNGIPHLIAPVVVEPDRVVSVLGWTSREMDRRYKLFASAGTRNIEAYNRWALARGEMRLPYIVVLIDELADLIMVSPEEVERGICRIAQLARATGIHLVIATQRPSVDVVTGQIKANFPARLAFLVSSQVDSRVILDVPGAEKLLGRGDALYMAPDSPKLLRVQGCWVSDDEIARIVSFWRKQVVFGETDQVGRLEGQVPAPVVQPALWPESPSAAPTIADDPLLAEATALVLNERRASVSFFQRKLRIGYTRAARLVDVLEQRGLIGGATGSSRPRDVILAPEDAPAADQKTEDHIRQDQGSVES